MSKKKVFSIVGARPNFMKVAPLHRAFQSTPSIEHFIVHTGQHYDRAMSDVFFDHLEIPEPKFYLGVGSDSHACQTAKIMIEFEKILAGHRPDLVIVVGDVNSTVACSLTAVKMGIAVAHVEAGLRSFDRSMPEEINRIVTDSISDLLFVSEPSGMENLRCEGIRPEKMFFVGNTMIDSLTAYRTKASNSTIRESLNLSTDKYVVVTLHRPVNVDSPGHLGIVTSILQRISEQASVVFPIHPRTLKTASEFGYTERLRANNKIKLIDPLGYLDFLHLVMNSAAIVTDSGGIQEETTFLGIPCITLRDSTERPVTVDIGTNVLAPLEIGVVVDHLSKALSGDWKKGRIPELWDGKASERIVTLIQDHFKKTSGTR